MPPDAPESHYALVRRLQSEKHACIKDIREKINALETVTRPEAVAMGATAATNNYFTRLLTECDMLLSAIKAEKKPEIVVLVKTKSGIAIWRKKA